MQIDFVRFRRPTCSLAMQPSVLGPRSVSRSRLLASPRGELPVGSGAAKRGRHGGPAAHGLRLSAVGMSLCGPSPFFIGFVVLAWCREI